MQRLKGLESQLTSANYSEKFNTKALLEKYKGMSNLDVPGFKKFLNMPGSYDWTMKFYEILEKDK